MDDLTSGQMQRVLGVGKVALNALANDGVAVHGAAPTAWRR
jgi:hypothetical protein